MQYSTNLEHFKLIIDDNFMLNIKIGKVSNEIIITIFSVLTLTSEFSTSLPPPN